MLTRNDLDDLEHDAAEHRQVRWPQERALELIGRVRELMDEVDNHSAGADYNTVPAGVRPTPGQLWASLLTLHPRLRIAALAGMMADHRESRRSASHPSRYE